MVRHPDRALVDRLLHGIECGVDVGYTGDRSQRRVDCANLSSAAQHEAAIDTALKESVRLGQTAGPFHSPPFPNFIVSPLGAVPKGNSGKIRVIHHLSYPRGGDSINRDIEPMECRLSSFDAGAALVAKAGRGALMTKIDVKSAYRCLPIRPQDWHLLGMKWRGKFYYDVCLGFGLSSSCALWEEYATAAEWVFKSLGFEALVHYIDDTLFVCPPGLAQAECKKQLLLSVFKFLGIPVSIEKLEGPVTGLLFLGIWLDSISMTASLGSARLAEIKALLASWSGKTRCNRVELEKLIGKLSFACKVVRPGRMFLRRMLNLLSIAKTRPLVTLNEEFALDLVWWRTFLDKWNGISILYEQQWTNSESLSLFTDASLLGAGGYFDGQWFSHAWTDTEFSEAVKSDTSTHYSMPYLELLALTLAVNAWGATWSGKRVLFSCDCEPVVLAVNKMTSPSHGLMHLLRILYLIAARYCFEFRAVHIAGVTNTYADALSRLQVSRFREELCPTASGSPTTLPPLPSLAC